MLGGLIIIFILQRLGLIFFGFQHIFHPLVDEPASGTLARDFLHGGLRVPLFVYQYVNHSGDVLIEGILLIPFFKIFGCSIFSIKLFALFSATICLACWIIFIKKFQGKWAAIIFTALFACAPPLFTRLNLIGTLSSHHIINPIMVLQFICLFKIAQNNSKKNFGLLWLLCGFLAGLGTYAFYSYIIFNVFCALFFCTFRASLLSLQRIVLMTTGFMLGLLPVILRAASGKPSGSYEYIHYLLNNISIVFANLKQTFLFNVPHSLSYATPGRHIGVTGVVFSLLIAAGILVILFDFRKRFSSIKADSLTKKTRLVDMPALQRLFCALFPIFFLICLSFSPKQINPFEHIPRIGLFPTFYPTDVIRYRWLFLLFPYYFAICAFSITILVQNYRRYRVCALAAAGLGCLLVISGAGKSLQMYSTKNPGSIFDYKGYSYDLVAVNFFLNNAAIRDLLDAESLAHDYPEENKPYAFQCLGTKALMFLAADHLDDSRLIKFIERTPHVYRNDVIYGIIRGAEMVEGKQAKHYLQILAELYPDLFYLNWGFRILAHTYYDTLFNAEMLLNNIPPAEQWFFRNFLDAFKLQLRSSHELRSVKQLIDTINSLPMNAQQQTLKGLGKFIGAEMLFEPLAAIDYPLDSKIGRFFSDPKKISFYEGVGCGFAETLCRYWRTLTPPDKLEPYRYKEMLEEEWRRCQTLLDSLPVEVLPSVYAGFIKELQQRPLIPAIKSFLTHKFNETL